MKHHSEPVISPIRRQAIDALLQARQLPIGRDRNELRQLAIGLRGLAALQEMKDWQSRTALIGGFVPPALDGRSLVIQKLARQFGVKLRQHEDSLL